MILEAFAPTTGLAFWGVGGCLASLIALGLRLQSTRLWMLPWLAAAAGLAATEAMIHDQPAGYSMLALCGTMLFGMKAVVGAASVRSGNAPLPLLPWLAFAVLWIGMRPKPFHGLGGPPRKGASSIAVLGARNIALGVLLLAAAHWAAGQGHTLVAYLCGLPGISLCVHFGLFHLQVALFRTRGVDVGPLFRNPPLSRSLSEFWGRRWNLAFSEMTAVAVHRPLRGRVGNGAAVILAFLFSGLLHELAISAPVHGGWGQPMGYFALHAAAMTLERRLHLQGWVARLWTIAWIVLPLPLLFHGPFRSQVIGPLLGL